MKRLIPVVLVFAGFLVMGQAFGAEGKGPLGKPNLFPVPAPEKPADSIIFSHKFHVVEQELTCDMCHGEVADATTAQQTKLPTMETCGQCHDVEDNCGMCHTNGDEPQAVFESKAKEIVFDHKAHLARKNVDCKTCHPKAYEAETSDVRLVPNMPTCTTCHQADMDRLACRTCHTRLPELGEAPTDVAVHKAGFFPIHGSWARGSSTMCAQCHEQRFCADCHEKTGPVKASLTYPEQVERKFVHRADWISRHALESQAKPASCLACHGTSFCSECHERNLEKKAEEGITGLAASPHPAGYVTRGGAGFHGDDARLNIQQCAACHDQGASSNCVECHKVGGPGGNPHPPGWNIRRGMDRDDRLNSGTCIPCHGAVVNP